MSEAPLEVTRACRLGLGGIVQLWCRGDGLAGTLRDLVRRPDGGPLPPADAGEIQYGVLTGRGGDLLDEVLLAWTEWGAELNCHGGTASARAALARLAERGFAELDAAAWWSRAAARGEVDLVTAEAGQRWPGALTPLQARLLAGADELLAAARDLARRLAAGRREGAEARLAALLADAERAVHAFRRFTVAIVGAPNVGKSSTFNALLAHERALVSPTPGTTRDAVRHPLLLGGLAVELVDTAGLFAAPGAVDAAAVARSREALAAADLRLLLLDGSRPLRDEDLDAWQAVRATPAVVAAGKADRPARLTDEALRAAGIKSLDLRFSPRQDRTLAGLTETLAAALWAPVHGPPETPGPTAFTVRQIAVLRVARRALQRRRPPDAARLLARLWQADPEDAPAAPERLADDRPTG